MSESESAARAARFYMLLVRLYPRDHRRTFGAQMLQTFKDQYQDAAEERARAGIAFWLGVIGDEARGILRERVAGLHARGILLLLVFPGAIEILGIAAFGPG